MPINAKIQSKEMDMLLNALLHLETLEECYEFFEDVCTMAEMHSISQRLQVAQMLRDKVTYQEISRLTGASTATISRVNRCVAYGSGGYELVLDRLAAAGQVTTETGSK